MVYKLLSNRNIYISKLSKQVTFGIGSNHFFIFKYVEQHKGLKRVLHCFCISENPTFLDAKSYLSVLVYGIKSKGRDQM